MLPLANTASLQALRALGCALQGPPTLRVVYTHRRGFPSLCGLTFTNELACKREHGLVFRNVQD